MKERLLFANSSNPELVQDVHANLRRYPKYETCELGDAAIGLHSDKEPKAEIKNNVRKRKCIVLANIATDATGTVNDHKETALSLLEALSLAGAKIKLVVLPYHPYARQERRTGRTGITARRFAKDLRRAAGFQHVCTIEPHDERIEMAYGRCSLDRIPILHVFKERILEIFPDPKQIIVVSPDLGGTKRAQVLATIIGSERLTASIEKRRPRSEVAKAYRLNGDVAGLDAVVVDDIFGTLGTIEETARLLIEKGVRRILVCGVHGLFCGSEAIHRLRELHVERILVTNTVAQRPEVLATGRVEVISVGKVIAQAIHCILAGDSLSQLGKTA